MVFSWDDYGSNFFIKLKGEKESLSYLKHPAISQYPERLVCNKHTGNLVQAHAHEWLDATKANKPEMCYSRFDIASRLVEIMLVWRVSLRACQKVEWDGPR